MAEIVWLEECLNWERWLRRQRQTLEQLRTPAATQQPTTPTSVCVFDHDDEPIQLWLRRAEKPLRYAPPMHSAVLLKWPKPTQKST
jgi:hypothetical protein